MWLWILIGLSIITKVHGYSNGNFPESCESMLPQHRSPTGGFFHPQSTDPPFDVEYEHGKNGEPLTVSLLSKTSAQFMGFLLEARKKDMVDKGCPFGKFILLDASETRLLTCNLAGNNCSTEVLVDAAVSQRNNHNKNIIRVKWTAQGEELDNIIFRATFLQSYSVFWRPLDVNVTLPPTTAPPPPPPSTQPSTTANTTVPSATDPSSSTNTTVPSATDPSSSTSTTVPSATDPSSTTSTTVPSTTRASTTASTSVPNTINPSSTSSPVPSATDPSSTASTTVPSTTSIAKASTTRITTVPSTTGTSKPSTTELSITNLSQNTKEGTVLMAIDIFIETVKMQLPIIFKGAITDKPFSRCLIKASKILCCVLCGAFEISSLVLFCKDDPIDVQVTLIALGCVVIAINIIELVISCLPIEPSHELKDICDYAVQVFSVIHMIFSFAVVFVGVLESEDLRKIRKESWLVKVMIAYTVLIFLSVIWTFVFGVHENAILGTSKIGTSKTHRRKKKLSAGQVSAIAVSVILIVGTLSFTVAVIAGVLG